MKKTLEMAILGLMLALALCMPAMAQTTGIAVDGKIYTFTGGDGTYHADGKTFIIDKETVTIQESGKLDRVMLIERTADTDIVQDEQPAFIAQSSQEDSLSVSNQPSTAVTEHVQSAFLVEDANLTVGTEAMSEYAQSSYVLEDAVTINPECFVPYEKFGLSYDAASDILTYQGQRVRIFEDSYPVEEQSCAALEHVDDLGAVDIKALRDRSVRVYNADGSYDPAGTLTGLYVLSDAEFAARNINDWTNPGPVQSTAVEGAEMTVAEKQALYAPYAAFGLSYDASTDKVTYQGSQVRRFLDIRKSNGEAMNSGRFHGVITSLSEEDGEIDVETIRDYTKLDADGNGTLIGMMVETVR